jgi:hypothetical protein
MHTTHTLTRKNTKQRSTTKVLRLHTQTHRLLKRVAAHHETTMMALLENLVSKEAAKVERALARRLAGKHSQPTAQVA